MTEINEEMNTLIVMFIKHCVWVVKDLTTTLPTIILCGLQSQNRRNNIFVFELEYESQDGHDKREGE